MMLTMTPKTVIAARTDSSGRAASGVVGGIRVVFPGDSSRTVASATISVNRNYQTQEDAGRNNKSQTFYRHDAAATYAKPQHGVVHHSEDGGRDGRVLSSAWRPVCGEG